jgi:predicted lipoprotein with Yx(FWY)xxD motif
VPGAGLLVTGVSVLALVVLGGSVAAAGGGSPVSASGGLKTATIGGATVLTNAKGFALYWFAPDTRTKSVCSGSCAAYWPPVKGPVALSSGITGTVGTIKRSDGTLQATYNGHPLYTYVADTAPGEAKGNNLNLNGGLWYEMKVSG